MSYAQLLFSLKGRVSRKTLWLKFQLPLVLFYILNILLSALLGTDGQYERGLLFLIVILLSIYPAYAVFIKRLHDRGRSGWFLLLMFVPLLNIWPTIEIYYLKGTKGKNRFGEDPLAS